MKTKKKLGKYIIEKKIGEGGFAAVYQARDTIEGIRVALKIPYAHFVTDESLEIFTHEVQLAAKLDHPHIQPLKYADFIDGQFVVVTALGLGTLEDRLSKRLSSKTALDFSLHLLEAVACAHENKIIHCDIKPDNLLLFPNNQLRLIDFGIARVALETMSGSGAGTIGYMAPEQAMGKPSFRSDVFSLGLVMHRMFAGQLPEWPFEWPFPGHEKLRNLLHDDMLSLIRKATEVESRRRYKDAIQMLLAFKRVRHPLKSRRHGTSNSSRSARQVTWKSVRFREFQRQFGKELETRPPMRQVYRSRRGDDDLLPMVWKATKKTPRRANAVLDRMPTLPSWLEVRLELLCLVLRRRVRANEQTQTSGPTISSSLWKRILQTEAAHAIHAILSLVQSTRQNATGSSVTARTRVADATGASRANIGASARGVRNDCNSK